MNTQGLVPLLSKGEDTISLILILCPNIISFKQYFFTPFKIISYYIYFNNIFVYNSLIMEANIKRKCFY